MRPTEPPRLSPKGSGESPPPTTTEARLVAVTFKGAYLARENLQDLNAVFAAADKERKGTMGRSLEAVKRMRDADQNIKVHYA